MIPFFRKIRKKMADDNRPLKYMRYAIGEIVLVVIGILIALQVNNWNEVRKKNKKYDRILMKVKEELKNNIINHNIALEYFSYIDSLLYDVNHKMLTKEKLKRDNYSVKFLYKYMNVLIQDEEFNNFVDQDFNQSAFNDSLFFILKQAYKNDKKGIEEMNSRIASLTSNYKSELRSSKTWYSSFDMEWTDEMFDYFLMDSFFYNNAKGYYDVQLTNLSRATERLRIKELKVYEMIGDYFNEKDTFFTYEIEDYKHYKGVFFKEKNNVYLEFKVINGAFYLSFKADGYDPEVTEVFPITSTCFSTGWADGYYYLILNDMNQVMNIRYTNKIGTKEYKKID